jgi:hypothetical protein
LHDCIDEHPTQTISAGVKRPEGNRCDIDAFEVKR